MALKKRLWEARARWNRKKVNNYFEDVEPAPGIMQLINQIEHKDLPIMFHLPVRAGFRKLHR